MRERKPRRVFDDQGLRAVGRGRGRVEAIHRATEAIASASSSGGAPKDRREIADAAFIRQPASAISNWPRDALGGNGTLTADQFVKNTTGLAGDGTDHIIYETDTGWLYYDSNGNAAGGSTHFATLAANLALTNADFVVM
ncbi:hypothetical protein B5V02_20865 [Mesorhizobium kowhaii]|uniref:Uncharacterized protein n=1 Tax=Mesorhizobium kowhaii TaxID=1300272 RepID=A0A2W7C1D6_9HYPH|nr:hypothetical protein B5V02_20865 [Mesorhizobium kowhaii]